MLFAVTRIGLYYHVFFLDYYFLVLCYNVFFLDYYYLLVSVFLIQCVRIITILFFISHALSQYYVCADFKLKYYFIYIKK